MKYIKEINCLAYDVLDVLYKIKHEMKRSVSLWYYYYYYVCETISSVSYSLRLFILLHIFGAEREHSIIIIAYYFSLVCIIIFSCNCNYTFLITIARFKIYMNFMIPISGPQDLFGQYKKLLF